MCHMELTLGALARKHGRLSGRGMRIAGISEACKTPMYEQLWLDRLMASSRLRRSFHDPSLNIEFLGAF